MAKLWKPSYANPIVFDIETYDPDLDKTGPGVYSGKAVVLGCAVMDPSCGYHEYFPLHDSSIDSGTCSRNKAVLSEILGSDRDKLAANAAYDVDFLENLEGIPVNGFIHDVQLAEPILDPYKFSFSLEALAMSYGVVGKHTVDIEREAARLLPILKQQGLFKGKAKVAAQQLLAWMDWRIVADYCKQDLPPVLEVWYKQMQLLQKEDLLHVYELECDMLRIRMMMRRNGIRVDQQARQRAMDPVAQKIKLATDQLYAKFGVFPLNSSAKIAAQMLDKLGAAYPATKTGAPSVTKEVLDALAPKFPDCATLKRARALDKLRNTFLIKVFNEHLCPDGRIHGQFHQLRKDDAGTITGRWSSTHPNLQQVPRNDKELGALIRGCYVPDEGCWYGHTDYSQIEYRVFLHFACGYAPGDELSNKADTARRMFNEHPETDYHQYVIDTVKELTGISFDRPTAKRVNFGVLYFMGAASLSNKFGIPLAEASAVYDALFSALPFILSTRESVVATAEYVGHIKTIIGRKQRIGPMHIAKNKTITFSDGHTVTGTNIKDGKPRDQTYPLFNYEIQGTAADIMKASLRECYRAGVYDVLKLHLLVHDETGVSIPKTIEGMQAYMEQKRIMETTVPLKVPVLAEADFGDNWGVMTAEGEDTFPEMRKRLGL